MGKINSLKGYSSYDPEPEPKRIIPSLFETTDEKSKPVGEVLDDIINAPAIFDFAMTNSDTRVRMKQLALICKMLVEIVDKHQEEIERLTKELKEVKNK
jgi:hypothetical protein